MDQTSPTFQVNSMTAQPGQSLNGGPLIIDWPVLERPPRLGSGEVHLWRLELDGDTPPSGIALLISDRERARARAITNPAARRTYERARAAKRRLLGDYLGTDPGHLRLDAGPRGKPFIAAPATDVRFNLTHSGELALLAVTRGSEIGLDVEQVRTRKGLERIARRMFDSALAESLAGLGEPERTRGFHVLWTRLEAGVKARGGGLFDNASRPDAGLRFASFVPLPGYQACVAMPEACPEPDTWRTATFVI
jgi:4'-phosphopantetheinyl transferase